MMEWRMKATVWTHGCPRRLKYLDSLLPCPLDPDQFSSRYPWPGSARRELTVFVHLASSPRSLTAVLAARYNTALHSINTPPSLLDAGVGRGVTPGDPVLPWIQLSTLIRGYVRSTLTYMVRVGMVERLAITHMRDFISRIQSFVFVSPVDGRAAVWKDDGSVELAMDGWMSADCNLWPRNPKGTTERAASGADASCEIPERSR